MAEAARAVSGGRGLRASGSSLCSSWGALGSRARLCGRALLARHHRYICRAEDVADRLGQRHAARTCDERACETHLAEPSPVSRGRPDPVSTDLRLHQFMTALSLPVRSSVCQFRVFLLRRIRLPLPLGATPLRLPRAHGRPAGPPCRMCHIRLASRAPQAEWAMARILPLRHGSQFAIDANIASPVTRAGKPHPRADTQPAWAADNAPRRKRRDIYRELARARRCCLIVIGIEVGDRFGC